MTDAAVRLKELLEQAAGAAGIDASTAVAIRTGAHAVFCLPNEIIARIGKPGSFAVAQRELQVSEWLEQSGIPTVTAAKTLAQPVVVDDRPVTWWHLIPDHRPSKPAELGAALRQLHVSTPPTDFQLPDYQPFAGVRERITSASALSDDDRAWLLDHYARLRQSYGQLPDSGRQCVIHGDAWQGNVVVPSLGHPTFLDLDKVSVGRPEWDLIQLAVDRMDFARLSDSDYHSFVAAYGGHDLTTTSGFRIYADIQELRWVSFAISLSEYNQSAGMEAVHRIACLRGTIPGPWTWNAL